MQAIIRHAVTLAELKATCPHKDYVVTLTNPVASRELGVPVRETLCLDCGKVIAMEARNNVR